MGLAKMDDLYISGKVGEPLQGLLSQESWYRNIEEPVCNLVKLLRDNGFNTFCSCGHLPQPYIQMEWYEDEEVTRLYNLLVENNYRNFRITAIWEAYELSIQRSRHLELSFSIEMPLAKESDICWDEDGGSQ